jgi:hypothetical protein
MTELELFSLWHYSPTKWRLSVLSFELPFMRDRRALLEVERTGDYLYYCVFYIFRKTAV